MIRFKNNFFVEEPEDSEEPKTPEEEMIRTINVPKNKLPGGGTKQMESERHGQYLVTIDPIRARFE